MLHLRLYPETLSELEAMADEKGMRPATFARMILMDYLKANRNGPAPEPQR